MADINKVWLTGLAVSQPVFTVNLPKTPFTVFTLEVNEQFIGRTGKVHRRPNFITIESIGRSAAIAASRVVKGGRYTVEGYLRVDDGAVKVRSFAIYKEESQDAEVYAQGLKQAVEIIERSRDRDTALRELRGIIDGKDKEGATND
jgi:hypothetical protein